MSHRQSFSYIGTGLPGLNQYKARINVSCPRTQGSDAGEARNPRPLRHIDALYVKLKVTNYFTPAHQIIIYSNPSKML